MLDRQRRRPLRGLPERIALLLLQQKRRLLVLVKLGLKRAP
jgi:hypothetical protein